MIEHVIDWFRKYRGIEPATLEAFGVRYLDNGDVIFPYPNGEKTRPDPTQPLGERRRFYFTKGQIPGLFMQSPEEAKRKFVFLVEGETDAMRLWQEFRKAGIEHGVVGLSGINTWRAELAPALSAASKVYAVLDNDADYLVKGQVDTAWKGIRSDLGTTRARRLYLPAAVKDICEFFDACDIETFKQIVSRPSGEQSRYRALDLRREPPPPDWLVEGLMSRGDVNLLSGASGLGKSWFTMGLTIAIAEGLGSFLGQPIMAKGRRVLYVDQENPDSVIFDRLRKLGLTPDGMSNIRYLWNCGIRLDRNPEEFLEEALDYQPELIVLDSLTRLHTQEENSAGAMAALFNDAVQPLARDTGAAVVLIHHDAKSGGPRGSGDITASVDGALHVRAVEEMTPGQFVLKQTKTRRRLGGDELIVRIKDNDDGTVTLDPEAPFVPPF